MTTRQNDVFPGVAIDETDIIPRRRHLLHEIYRPSRSVRQIVGGEGKMLHGRLEQYGRSQRIDIGRHPTAAARFVFRIVILVQRTATEVHTAHRIPDERMQAGIESLGIATFLREVQVLTGQYRLTGHEIGIHPLPTARKSATVVNHHQTVIVGISQDVLVKLHGLLLVASDKVYLNTPDAGFLHPFHFTTTDYHVVHATTRPLRRVVPITVGIVPQI